MSRTEQLFQAMKAFTDTRTAARESYFQTMKNYEADKGSKFYAEKMSQALDERNRAVDAAKAAALETVSNVLKGMRDHASKRKLNAPTDEQLRLLTALQMRDKLTLNELSQAANAMNGNGAGLAILEEIAQKQGTIHPNFNAMATDGLSFDAAQKAVDNLAEACKRILNGTGATRAGEAIINRQSMMGYNKLDRIAIDALPQEAPYESEQDFYSRNINMPYETFADAVNGEE